MSCEADLHATIARVEREARAILRALKWPTDPDDPWFSQPGRRKNTPQAERDDLRGLMAWTVLLELQEVRAAVEAGDAARAAWFALEAGIHAFDGTHHWALAQQTRTGGRVTGEKISADAAKRAKRTLTLYAVYQRTTDTPSLPEAVAWIADRQGEHPKTIRGRLKKEGIVA